MAQTELEVIFYRLAKLEEFTTSEMADSEYMRDKIAVWIDNGYISQREHDLLQENWGVPCN